MIICARKLSFSEISRQVSHWAGRCVNNTRITTEIQINGITCKVYTQVPLLNPISKQVIRGAMILTDITDTMPINRANSFLFLGSFIKKSIISLSLFDWCKKKSTRRSSSRADPLYAPLFCFQLILQYKKRKSQESFFDCKNFRGKEFLNYGVRRMNDKESFSPLFMLYFPPSSFKIMRGNRASVTKRSEIPFFSGMGKAHSGNFLWETLYSSTPRHKMIFHQSVFFMVNEILFFSISTESTLTFTVSPSFTASRGCLMKRLQIWEICTSPS